MKTYICWQNGELQISNTVSGDETVAREWARFFERKYNIPHWVEVSHEDL